MTDLSTPQGGVTDAHLSDEALAEAAGALTVQDEPSDLEAVVSAQEAAHLAQCTHCQENLRSTQRVLAALQDPIDVEEPPAGLWDRIAAELPADPDDRVVALPAAEDRPERDSGADTPEGDSAAAPVAQLQPRQNRRGAPWWGVLAAAAAGALIGAAAIAGILSQDEEETPVAGAPVGGATLEPVEADDFSGQAQMVALEDGSMELTLEITSAPDPADGYFEVWLRDEDASRLISLGAVTADSTTLQVPAGIELSDYPVVDVSHEHFDGDPNHGGVTLAAGPMEEHDD